MGLGSAFEGVPRPGIVVWVCVEVSEGSRVRLRYNITHMHVTARNTLLHFGHVGGFSGPNSTSRTVMGSDLVLSVCNTCADQYTVLWVTSRYNITLKCSKRP